MLPANLFGPAIGGGAIPSLSPVQQHSIEGSSSTQGGGYIVGGQWTTPASTFTNSSATTSPGDVAQQFFSSLLPATPQPLPPAPQSSVQFNCFQPPPQQQQPATQQQIASPVFPPISPQVFQAPQQQVITIVLQYGLAKECVVIERTTDPNALHLLRQKARQIVERQMQFELEQAVSLNNLKKLGTQCVVPLSSTTDIHLFRHDYSSAALLAYLTSLMQLDNGSVVEIIRIDRNDQSQLPTKPHKLDVHTYLTPTFCDYCGEMLMGIAKQGLQCQLCKCNFHKKCVFGPRNNCAKNESLGAPTTFLTAGTDQYPLQNKQHGIATPNANGAPSDKLPPNMQLPHTLSIHNYVTPTVCKICDKMLVGLFKQGLRCRDCKVNVHKKCAHLLPSDCLITAQGTVVNARTGLEQMSITETPTQPGLLSTNRNQQQQESMDQTEVSMIPLGRLPGSASCRSARHGGATGAPLCEGWLVHFILQETTRRRLRHYWILQNGAINLYNEYNDGVNPHRVYKRIQLGEIIAIIPFNGPPIDDKHPPHCFEIRTIQNLTFCVGENLEVFASLGTKLLPHNAANGASTTWQSWFQVEIQLKLF